MKGLIIKDYYTLVKQLGFFLIFIVVFACLPGFSFLTFAIVYATMLPMTSIAYDERAKWDKFACMMPYSAMDLVLSKYMLGLFIVLATAVFSCFAQAVVGIFTHTVLDGPFFAQLALIVCFAIIIESIELPVLIGLGVEKGRLLMIVFMVAAAVGGATLVDNVVKFSFKELNLAIIIPAAALAAVIVGTISVMISVALYKGKKE
ncbi:MAG: ABC-2 transporter permease [Oscillospiraceae bacterium]